MSPITLEVQHTPQTISSLSYVQYSATHGLKKCVQVITAVVCLLLGTRLVGSIEPPFNYLFSAYGCFAILFLNLPAKWRSEKIIRQIQASKRGFPRSVFRFGEDGFHVTTKGVKGKGDFYAYGDCHRLLEHHSGLYYFINREAAFVFPPESLKEVTPDAFKAFLQEHTHLQFTQFQRGWNATLRSILHTRKNTR